MVNTNPPLQKRKYMFNLRLESLFYNEMGKEEIKNVKPTKLRKMDNQEKILFKKTLYNLFRIKAKTKPISHRLLNSKQYICFSLLYENMKCMF